MKRGRTEEDDVRSMLSTKAGEATVSDDPWGRTSLRLAEPPPSLVGRRLAVAGVTVAVAAATVFVLNVPGSPIAVTVHTASHDQVLDPAPTVSVWPAADEAGLEQLQADAEQGRRPDLLDPVGVAGGYLAELLPGDRSPQRHELAELRAGDATSAEVAFRIDGVDAGEVMLHRSGFGRIWHVAGVSSGLIRLGVAELHAGGLTVDGDGEFDRYEALVRTPGGGLRRASGPSPGTVRMDGIELTYWVQVVAYRGDRLVGIAVVPVRTAS